MRPTTTDRRAGGIPPPVPTLLYHHVRVTSRKTVFRNPSLKKPSLAVRVSLANEKNAVITKNKKKIVEIFLNHHTSNPCNNHDTSPDKKE
jgi:hypothetical protein